MSRIISRQVLEGQLLVKSSASVAKRIGVDVESLIEDMNAALAKVKAAAKAVESDAVSADDAFDYVQANVFDTVDDIRSIADSIRALTNVRQFANQTAADIKRFEKKILKLQKSGESVEDATALLEKLRADFTAFRPLAAKRLTQDTVDSVVASIQVLSDDSDQLKEELGMNSTDTLIQRLQSLVPGR